MGIAAELAESARVEDGRVVFPFDSIRVEFLLHAA
jgi:hypothetical protein